MRNDEAPWVYVAVEFGRFGWGRTPEPILPRQYEICIARVSVGPGGLSEGLLSAMRQAGRAHSAPTAKWQRLRMRCALRRVWLHVQAQFPIWLAIGCFSVACALLVVALTMTLGWQQ